MRLFLCALAAFLLTTACHNPDGKKDKVIVAYVTSWSDVLPVPSLMTHINYAFGHVGNSYDSVRIDNPERLKALAKLKETSDVKILLSIGGWGSGRFSEMAANDSLRSSFARNCRKTVDMFGIDGIDIDWEYPGTGVAGISSSPADRDNFTLLMRDLRSELGGDKLLTLAGAANARYIDFSKVVPYVDFVNVMTYDMGWAPEHNSPLFRSEHTGKLSCDDAVKAHREAGVPNQKIVMGIPFYGRGPLGEPGTDYGKFVVPEGCRIVRDTVAMVPFVVDSLGNYIMGFDDVESISLKCKYINENDLRGAMYWDYAADDSVNTLARTVRSLSGF